MLWKIHWKVGLQHCMSLRSLFLQAPCPHLKEFLNLDLSTLFPARNQRGLAILNFCLTSAINWVLLARLSPIPPFLIIWQKSEGKMPIGKEFLHTGSSRVRHHDLETLGQHWAEMPYQLLSTNVAVLAKEVPLHMVNIFTNLPRPKHEPPDSGKTNSLFTCKSNLTC